MKKKYILLTVLTVVTVLIAFAGIKLFNSPLGAFYKAMKYSDEDIKQKIEESKEILKKETGIEVRKMNEEEKKAAEKGEKTAVEIYEKIINDAIETEKDNIGEKKYDADVVASGYLARIYALQDEYEGKIVSVIDKAREEYYYLRIEQKVGKEDAMKRIGDKYFGDMNALEGECDDRFGDIVTSMEKELKNNDCDTSLADSARKAYEGEKDAKRAYYIKTLMGNNGEQQQ